MFFTIEKSEKTTFGFSQNAATVVWFWLRLKMEIQKIANLLGDLDDESSKFATRKWYVINDPYFRRSMIFTLEASLLGNFLSGKGIELVLETKKGEEL